MEPATLNMLTTKRWIGATAAGWFAGVVMIIVSSVLFDSIGLEEYQFSIGISMGGCVGLFQWLTARTSVSLHPGWILASLAGMGFPFLLNDLLLRFYGISFGSYYLPASVLLGGLLTAVFQYIVLKKRFAGASQWLIPGWSGWIGALITIVAIDFVTAHIKNLLGLFLNLTFIVSGGPLLGWITASTIKKIFSTFNGQ